LDVIRQHGIANLLTELSSIRADKNLVRSSISESSILVRQTRDTIFIMKQ
jgi:hypothetical protein